MNELACDVLVFRFSATGTDWKRVGRFELPQTPDGDALAAHIAFAPDGRQLYASVRGSECIARFAIDEDGNVGSRADFASGGRGPRQFSLSSDGRFLAVANLASDNVCIFARDAESGALRAIARASVSQPACVVWDG